MTIIHMSCLGANIYLKLAGLIVHGKLGKVHGAHEPDPGGKNEQDLVDAA